MTSVGIRELKNHLSAFLNRVRSGERLEVTDRGRAIAIISPPAKTVADQRIKAMLEDGVVRWKGGKPKGAKRPPRIKGESVAQAVIEGRR
jgi:prevent-host-death family protein